MSEPLNPSDMPLERLLPLVATSGNYDLYKSLVEQQDFYSTTPKDSLNLFLPEILESAIKNNKIDFALKLLNDLEKSEKLKNIIKSPFFYLMIDRLMSNGNINDDVIDKILKASYGKINFIPENAYFSLVKAQTHGLEATSQFFINMGVFRYDMVRLEYDKNNPLTIAVKNNQYGILKNLLALFKNFDFKNQHKRIKTAVNELLGNVLLIAIQNNDTEALKLIATYVPNYYRDKYTKGQLRITLGYIKYDPDSERKIKDFINGNLFYLNLQTKNELLSLKNTKISDRELVETVIGMINHFYDIAHYLLISSNLLKNRDAKQDDLIISLMQTFHYEITRLNLPAENKFELLTVLEKRSALLFKDPGKTPSSEATVKIYADIASTKAFLLLDHFVKLDAAVKDDRAKAALISKQLKNVNSPISIKFHQEISNSLISEITEESLWHFEDLSFSMSKRLIALLMNNPEVRQYDSDSLKTYINRLGVEDKKIVEQHKEAIIKLCLANDIIKQKMTKPSPADLTLDDKPKAMYLFGELIDTSPVEAAKKQTILTLFKQVPKAKTKNIRDAQLKILNFFDDHLKKNPHDPKYYIACLELLNFLANQLSKETRKFWTNDHSRLEKIILLKRNEVINYLYDSGFDINLPKTMELGEDVSDKLLGNLREDSKKDPKGYPEVIALERQFNVWRLTVETNKIKDVKNSWKILENRAKKAKVDIPTLDDLKPPRLKK